MAVPTAISAEPTLPSDAALRAALDRLWGELPRLGAVSLSGELANRLADHAAALRFLIHADADRPLLVGLVGGASCGKSTVFNSLVGRRLSRVHYQPHSSLGPIVSVHQRHRWRLLPESPPRRFLPQFAAAEVRDRAPAATGAVDTVVVSCHQENPWGHLAIVDLPDITSESARREGWLVRRILPWLDVVVWLVDPNDYLFEDLYIDLIEQAAALGQRAIVVVNDIHGQVVSANTVLQERIGRFRGDAWFLLPPLQCSPSEPYPLFRSEPGFLKLRDFLLAHRTRRPLAPLAARLRHDAEAIVHANAEWVRLARELSTGLTRLVARNRKRILASAPVLSVLPESARAELERLRNRLSLWHHGKRLFRVLRSPVRTLGRAAVGQFQITAGDLDTEPLYRHLVGALKEFGVELHRVYLESRLVARTQEQDPGCEVLGSFDPETLGFKTELDAVARHLFRGAEEMLSDPSLWKDPKLHFVGGTTGLVLAFFLVESLLGIPGVTTLVGSTVTALVGVLSPELAKLLPMDRVTRLARDARDMLGAILDRQMQQMIDFYAGPRGRYLEPGNPLLGILEELQATGGPLASWND